MSALHYAAEQGHMDVANILLQHGASPQLQSSQGCARGTQAERSPADLLQLSSDMQRKECNPVCSSSNYNDSPSFSCHMSAAVHFA